MADDAEYIEPVNSVRLRRAGEDDLPGVWEILHTIEYGRSTPMSPAGDPPSNLRHELTTGTMWVAETGGALVGYAALIVRGGVGFIAELFVRRESQSARIGGALLAKLLEAASPTFCTMSSGDPRALSLYIRAGLQPRWPHFQLIGSPEHLPRPGPEVEVWDVEEKDETIIGWDAEISGRARAQEHAYWRSTHAVPLWVCGKERTVGYGYVHRTPATAGAAAGVLLGPIGARSAADAAASLDAILRWSRPFGHVVHVGIPGPHPSLPVLLRAGFRLKFIETYCCSNATDLFDPRTYIPSTTIEGTALL